MDMEVLFHFFYFLKMNVSSTHVAKNPTLKTAQKHMTSLSSEENKALITNVH